MLPYVPVDGRVAVRASGTFPSELLRDQVASSFPPCWTNDKGEGYVPGLALIFAPTANTSVSLLVYLDVAVEQPPF